MKKILICCLLLCGLVSGKMSAQTPVVVDYEKKVIYTDSLTLPMSINVGALLRLVPELLQRPDGFILSHYDVQVEGVTVGDAADAVLTVLQLSDIEKLEISNSPTSSDLNGGQSGSINLCLRPLGASKLGISGKAAMGFSTEYSSMADLLMDYKGKKVTVRGMAFGENLTQTRDVEFAMPRTFELQTDEKFWAQHSRAMITYNPNDRNELVLTLSERTSYTKENMDAVRAYNDFGYIKGYTADRERAGQFLSNLEYTHKVGKAHSLKLAGRYTYNPKHTWTCENGIETADNRLYGNAVEASAEMEGVKKIGNEKGSWYYKAGTKGATADNIDQLMPYVETSLTYGPLRMKAAAEYQWNSRERSDWTGRMVLGWQIDKANRVRLLMDRQLNRPEMLAQVVGMDYISDLRWGKHLLSMNAGVNYCKTSGIPEMSHYSCANLMAIYQYDIFFLSMTSNYYRRKQVVTSADQDKYCSYYNMSIMPSLNLKSGWRTAMNLRYYSEVDTRDSRLGHCMSLQMNVGKSWGNWNVYAYGRTPLTGKTETHDKVSGLLMLYDLITGSLGCGASWRF